MRHILLALAAACPLVCVAQDQKPLLNTPPTKADEIRKYHTPEVTPMPASERMKAYRQRLEMEKMSPFSQIKWRNVGPETQGGRVIDFETPASNRNQYYVAYATGGLWRSEDLGNTWTSLFDNESAFAIGDFALSRDGKTIWIGTGENNSQRTSYSGTGVFKSTDAGKTWQHMGLEATHRIGKVLINPKNENEVYVGALGALYSKNPERGVFKTTDGGRTWQHVLKIDDYTGVIDMAMDPRDPNVLYATTWDRERRAWNFREGGPGTGIYKSINGGKSWTKLAGGLPNSTEIGRIGIAVAPSQPNTVYAFLDNQAADPDTLFKDDMQPTGVLTPRRFKLLNEDMFVQIDKAVLTRFFSSYLPSDLKVDDAIAALKDKKMTLGDIQAKMLQRNPDVFNMELEEAEIYRSDDAGKTWRRTHTMQIGNHGGYYTGRIVVHPTDPNTLWTTGWVLLKSSDGGKTWKQKAEEVHVDFHSYYVDPENPRFQAVGNDGGLYLSYDSGETWRHMSNMPVGQFTTLAVDNKRPYNIYGGLQDNGTMKGPSNYRFGQTPPTAWTVIGWGDGSALAVDPRDDGDLVYGAWQFGAHYAINQKTNERWNIRPPGERGETLRFNWISPIFISTHHPDLIYLGSQKLHRSLDRGRGKWEALSGDLTKNLPNGDVPFSTTKDISESSFQFGLIYVGCDDGTVKMTKDHGATWTDISTPAKDRWVMRVVASKWDKATVYVAQNGYRQDEWTPYLWKSTDYGKTWKSIVSNLPYEPINVVREDPNKKGVLYVGTDLGAYISFDDGGTWETLHGGLPRTPVHDLVIQPRDNELVLASHARSVWVLPLKTVHLADPELRKKDIFVWPVDEMTRRNWGYNRRGEWDVEDPESPKIDVQVWVKDPAKGTVRIKDKDGKVVKEKEVDFARGFNFVSLDLKTAPGKPGTLDPRGREIKTPQDALKDPYEETRAQFLPAGDYKIEVVAGSFTQVLDWRLRSG